MDPSGCGAHRQPQGLAPSHPKGPAHMAKRNAARKRHTHQVYTSGGLRDICAPQEQLRDAQSHMPTNRYDFPRKTTRGQFGFEPRQLTGLGSILA